MSEGEHDLRALPRTPSARLYGIRASRLPRDAPPRVRAGLMLDALEDERLCELTDTGGPRHDKDS